MIEQSRGDLDKGASAETNTLKKRDNSGGSSLIPSLNNGCEGCAGRGKTSTETHLVMTDVRFIRFSYGFLGFLNRGRHPQAIERSFAVKIYTYISALY